MSETEWYAWSGGRCTLGKDCDMDHIVDPMHPGLGVGLFLCDVHRAQINAADEAHFANIAQQEAALKAMRKLRLIRGGA